LFIRPDYWIVVDVLAPSDDRPHVYEALFHLDVESAAIDETSAAVIGKTAAGGLAILPLTPQGLSATIAQGQREPVVQGWLPTGRHNELRPIPTAVLRAEGAGRRVLAYALVPFSMETSLPRVEPVASGDGALTAKLTWADGAVHEFAYGPDGLTLAATRPDGSTRRFEPKG
jgi:YD repeat-containing protein